LVGLRTAETRGTIPEASLITAGVSRLTARSARSLLIAARDEDGSTLTDAELVDTCLLVISAGHETTVNLLDQAIHALITRPEQLAHVRVWSSAGQAHRPRRHRRHLGTTRSRDRPPVVVERFPNLTLAVPAAQLTPVASFISNGHQSLPVLLHG
jgi:hypothetical protein